MTTSESNRLYDRYLESCLDGVVEPPEAFCTRHGATSAGLRRRLDTLYELHRVRNVQRAEPTAEAPDANLPFERLGEFRLLRQLGEGGMGRLYLAEQESLGRRVALKIVKPELRASPTAIERFRREAFAVAKLQHPTIVRVIATGEDAGVLFLAMELVPGRGLDELLDEARGPLPWRRVVGWTRAVAAALAYAHESGVLHRDVKPANIRIKPDGEPVLLDFGLARDERWSGQTLTHAFAGSPLYAAPEQLAGRAVDGRVDVYALGVTLFEAATGRLPFPEGPTDQLLHRVLTEEPIPPRKLEPSLPRDLETVTLKALQKAPRDRYASVGAFASDLEAVLDDRPIAARPPGPVTRLRRWARRRPWPAASIAAVLAILVALAVSALLRASQRRADARNKVAQARTRLTGYRESRAALQEIEERVVELQQSLHAKYFTEEEDRLLEESESAIERARREREVAFYEVLELLRRAEELDPDVAGADAVRADLYLQRWHEARAKRDDVGATFYRELVERHDVDRRHDKELRSSVEVWIESDPPGASVYLFRFVRAENEHRMVPVPVGAEPPVPPGSYALRVVRGAGDLQPEDLILDVPPGKSARVFRDGRVWTQELPPGLDLRKTAAPFFVSEACRIGVTPFRDVRVDAGRWFVLVRKEGYEPLRSALHLMAGASHTYLPLKLDREQVPGFRRVDENTRPFWIMEREVTAAEYLEFLNDPATRARIDASKTPILFPRDNVNRDEGGFWERLPDGRFALSEDWSQDWPVLGVTWSDATAFAAWRSQHAPAGFEYRLPTLAEWDEAACGGSTERQYPWGNRFRPKWTSSCYSRPSASPEPVMQYPIDESLHGVYDMAGSAREWLADWFDESKVLRTVVGGSWAHAQPKQFEMWGEGARPDMVSGVMGFRLVMVPKQ